MNVILSIQPYFKYIKQFGWDTGSAAKDSDLACQFFTVAQDAKRELLKLLQEPCTEHLQTVRVPMFDEFDDPEQLEFPDHRYLCPECMEEIEEKLK